MQRSEIDVAAIMQRIRDQNAERRARGQFTDEELLDIARERLRTYAAQAAIDPRLLDRFLGPGHDWNIATDYIIRTHRRGLLPRLSLIVKRLVRPVVRLYTDHVLNRQTQINQYLFHLLRRSILDGVRLEAQLAAMQARCESLERRLDGAGR
jgi:hypothetical protein